MTVLSSLLYDIVKQSPTTTLVTNASVQLFHNTSSKDLTGWSYIIPFDRTQDCNIYGPLCQTGSITVGVNLTTATTNTVLPCSSYLSAQSAHLNHEQHPDDQGGLWWPGVPWDTSDMYDWEINFGHSPKCRSYAQAMSKGQYTISECGSSNTIIQTAPGLNFSYPSQIPPGVVLFDNPGPRGTYTCCGNCSLDIPEVRLYYFPDKDTVCHDNQTTNITSALQARDLGKRIHSLVGDGSTAVVSGHTL